MNLKILILTIIVGILTAASVYFVVLDFNERKKAGAISSSSFEKSQMAFVLPVAESTHFPMRDWNIFNPEVNSRAAIVYDVRSEKILYQKNLDAPLPVASITKLLTAMVVVENIDPSEKITITSEAMNVSNFGGADFYLNEVFEMRELLRAMLIKSSNDASMAFEVHLRNGGINLIDEINKKAEVVGMNNSRFYDSSGLDNKGFSTVRDLVRLAEYVSRYPQIQDILLTKNATINSADGRFSHQFNNTNRLLEEIPDIRVGKTGYTSEAMGSLLLKIGLPQFNSSIVVIVLGSQDRVEDIRRLVNWVKQAHRWE